MTPQPLAPMQLPLSPAPSLWLTVPNINMQRAQKRALVADYRWSADVAVNPAKGQGRRWQSLILWLIVMAIHGGLLLWLLTHAAPEIVELQPQPIQVALIAMPAKTPAEKPAVVPVIEKQKPKKTVTTAQKTAQQTPVERPLPVVEPIVESASNQPKYEAKVADSAPSAEAPQAAAPTPAVTQPAAQPRPDIEEKEEPPKFGVAYLNNPAPEYPRMSKRAGEQGRVLMKVLVTTEGMPASVDIQKSSGFERLDAAAINAVKQWRFEPARKGGKAVSAYVLVPLSFTLN